MMPAFGHLAVEGWHVTRCPSPLELLGLSGRIGGRCSGRTYDFDPVGGVKQVAGALPSTDAFGADRCGGDVALLSGALGDGNRVGFERRGGGSNKCQRDLARNLSMRA